MTPKCSFRCLHRKIQYIKIVSNCSSTFTADIYGAIEAINYTVNVVEENGFLATDLKNSTQAVRKHFPNNPITHKIRKASRNWNRIFIQCWLPSQIAIHGFERAFKLTEQATTHPLSTNFQQNQQRLQILHHKNILRKVERKIYATQPNKLSETTDCFSLFFRKKH